MWDELEALKCLLQKDGIVEGVTVPFLVIFLIGCICTQSDPPPWKSTGPCVVSKLGYFCTRKKIKLRGSAYLGFPYVQAFFFGRDGNYCSD